MKRDTFFSICIICLALAIVALFATRLYAANRNYHTITDFKSSITKILIQHRYSGTILLAEHGKILYSTGIGYADDVNQKPNDRYTTFPLFSLTKQFTAAAILQLCADGNLQLTDTLDTFFPDYAYGKKITIRHLLEMTSGIPDYITDDTLRDVIGENAYTDGIDPQKLLQLIFSQPLRFIPGSKHEYSNANYYLLGLLIEQITHENYASYIKSKLLSPTGIIKYAFSPQKAEAIGFDTKQQIQITEYDASITGGAGCLVTNIVDLLKWEHALFSNAIPNVHIYKQFTEQQPYSCGLKFDGTKFYHEGEGIVFRNAMYYYPEESLCIILLSNHSHIDTNALEGKIHKELVKYMKNIHKVQGAKEYD